jgi:L-ascorbate metabolism protein UlaG (beta-lactamase superfamily)
MRIFGKNPSGVRLSRIQNSPNYANGAFQNPVPTVVTLKEASLFKMMKEYFNRPGTTAPPGVLPSVRTDLRSLPGGKPVIVWFGHSSYLLSVAGLNILVDPVFSGNASPFTFFGKSFPGSDVYGVADLPDIDIVVLTHDHYDHLDYKTIRLLGNKAKHFYTSLGVGSHLEFWGISGEKITELDWWEQVRIAGVITLTATPARHFSGRGITRNKTLWSSFVLKIQGYSIFLGGDSGYGEHFKTIGDQHGPFDIAILESGQYGKNWPYIHMLPEETVAAATALGAKALLPVHWGKFSLSLHPWNEPIERIVRSAADSGLALATPLIGEPVILDTAYPQKTWWEF